MIRFRTGFAVVVTGSLAVATAVSFACGGLTTSEIIQTSEAENKVQNAASTSTSVAATRAAGGESSAGVGSGGQSGLAGQLRATAAAEATATAQAGGGGDGGATAATATPSPLDAPEPAGDPLTGEVTVQIGNAGAFDPAVIKIKVGTKVTWENPSGTGHQTASDPGQAEQWDSGIILRPIGASSASFAHTFATPGRYTYRSLQPTDTLAQGVIYVVP
jgi:plastocyanin